MGYLYWKNEKENLSHIWAIHFSYLGKNHVW